MPCQAAGYRYDFLRSLLRLPPTDTLMLARDFRHVTPAADDIAPLRLRYATPARHAIADFATVFCRR